MHPTRIRGNKMDINDLAKKLSEMYENAGKGNKVTMIHLFGIRYAEKIKMGGFTAGEIIRNTKLKNGNPMSDAYQTEIQKGIKLSKYVVEK